MKNFGDPRDPEVDVVDWIERIPLAEPRYYVHRTLENLQVYRARLGSPELRLEQDLTGFRPGSRQVDLLQRRSNPGEEHRAHLVVIIVAACFGFITATTGEDLFVHHTDIVSEGYRSLQEGAKVQFEIVAGQKGPRAAKVEQLA